jgi:hypothetical protein
VKVDLERSDVVSVDLRGSRDEDEPAADVNVSLEGETEQAEELFERAQSTRRGGSSLRTPRLVGIGLDATLP